MMGRRMSFMLAIGVMCASGSFGLVLEQNGPRPEAGGNFEWPQGILELVRHESRVYSLDAIRESHYYFETDEGDILELIHLFSQARMRDHVVFVKSGRPTVRSMDKEHTWHYNVELHIPSAFAMLDHRDSLTPDTCEPTLIIYIDAAGKPSLPKEHLIPTYVIVRNEAPNSPWKDAGDKPERKVWYANVELESAVRADSGSSDVWTRVTLWERGKEGGIDLGAVGKDGIFDVALSDEEVASLRSGKSWLTLTAGNSIAEAAPTNRRLNPDQLALVRQREERLTLRLPGTRGSQAEELVDEY